MNKTVAAVVVLAVAAIAFLASGYSIPNAVRQIQDAAQGPQRPVVLAERSPGPRDGVVAPGTSPRNSRGDICQLGEDCRPNEVQIGGGR